MSFSIFVQDLHSLLYNILCNELIFASLDLHLVLKIILPIGLERKKIYEYTCALTGF